ncbi:MAG TPA: DUF6438 domain-containing protein [Saprospiraceae bacterium]|nr:DUF6438 domain-containing protein [Saprospiraceae bacterium]
MVRSSIPGNTVFSLFIKLVFLAGLIFSACSPKSAGLIKKTDEPSDTSNVKNTAPYLFLSFMQTGGYGLTPQFRLSIYSDGNVFYEGLQNVPDLGKFEGRVTEQTIAEIRKEARAVHFFDMNEQYPVDGNFQKEFPTTILFLQTDLEKKEVKDNYLAPGELIDFERYLKNLIEKLELTRQE